VGYVITPMGDGLPGTSWVYSGEGVEIARVPDARPFAFVPGGIVKVGGEAEARAWLAENGPLDPVVVEQCCGEKTVEPSSARVRVLRRDLDRTELQVTAPAPVTVVVLESYWPGWIATVDGREVPIAPADLHFQAVDVPGGRHDVVLSYRPANVAAGQAVSGAGLAVLCLLIVVGLRRRRFGLARATRG
jgi:hypothetical protein